MNKNHQMVSFRIAREIFGVPIAIVQEIVRVPEVTPVPDMPAFITGVINLRGKIVPVIDLSKRLKLEGTSLSRSSRILILEVEKKVIGLLVDAVTEIIRIPPESIEPPPEIISPIAAEYLIGVGKLPNKLVILLDLRNILKPEELKRFAAEGRNEKAAAASSPAFWNNAAV
jgi:purine-binding chemotaxis protein CheW